MTFQFGHMQFCIENDRIFLTGVQGFSLVGAAPFCEVQIAGEIKDSHLGIQMINSSEGQKLR